MKKEKYLSLGEMESLVGKPVYDNTLKEWRVLQSCNVKFTDSFLYTTYEPNRYTLEE